MLSISMGQDPDTPTYMKILKVGNISHVRLSERQKEDSTAVISLGCINWNIYDVAS